MKVSTKWLNEYVNVADLKPEELAEKIERTAVEVDGTSRRETGLKKIVVGHTLKVEQHPNADHLHVCQVDVGEDEPYQIVCGAPNIAADQKVIVALPNSRIAGNEKIKKGKMRGIVSMGMICALQEIGFPEAVVPQEYVNGIYVLPDDAVPGDPVFKYLGMDEDIIDVDITPNRADMLSMRGVAREVGAMYDRPVNLPEVSVKEDDGVKVDSLLSVAADEQVAPTYLTRVIRNVHVAPSPLWLQIRLWNAGIRPVNNVVDATNYALLEYGQPLHAFDYNEIAGKQLTVRQAQEGESLTTLDGTERKLKTGDVVVADANEVVALAGIMGGARAAVTNDTADVVLEAAVFNPTAIRKTSRRENLHTEAAMRFERGINQAAVVAALDAAAQLIMTNANGQVAQGILEATRHTATDVTVTVSLQRINDVLGTKLTATEVTAIFKRLGFNVTEKADTFTVSIPPFRWDISLPADLIEEIARIYGYDKLPATLPAGATTPGARTPKQRFIRSIRQALQEAGLDQAISYGLTTATKAQRFMFAPATATELAFPMSSDRTTARMNLLSGLLDDAAYNVHRKVQDVALYEQGRVFLGDGEHVRPQEVEHVAGVLTGLFRQPGWNQPKQPVDFYVAKGIVEHLLRQLGISGERYVSVSSHAEMHPGRTADVYVGETFVGFVGEVHPDIAKENHLKRTYVFELDVDALFHLPKDEQQYTAVSKFPEVTRDIALAVRTDVTNEQLTQCIVKNGGAHLTAVRLFDVYQGDKMAPGMKSLAYTLVYRDPTKTLVDEDVNRSFNKIVRKLQDEFDVEVR